MEKTAAQRDPPSLRAPDSGPPHPPGARSARLPAPGAVSAGGRNAPFLTPLLSFPPLHISINEQGWTTLAAKAGTISPLWILPPYIIRRADESFRRRPATHPGWCRRPLAALVVICSALTIMGGGPLNK